MWYAVLEGIVWLGQTLLVMSNCHYSMLFSGKLVFILFLNIIKYIFVLALKENSWSVMKYKYKKIVWYFNHLENGKITQVQSFAPVDGSYALHSCIPGN